MFKEILKQYVTTKCCFIINFVMFELLLLVYKKKTTHRKYQKVYHTLKYSELWANNYKRRQSVFNNVMVIKLI